ncbi:vesicle transport protein SEC20-like, partial [Harmonia axyridis]|uniref:vesicle transport protein SEC20-like n=1 Tax=Harmonia axyridis TaxID=115357 RepID=UPI001E274F80
HSTDIVLENLRKNITEQSFQIKALIQDINDCGGPLSELSELHTLNSEGRIKIASLRKYIDKFWEVAEENKNANLLKEVLLHRDQLSSTMDLFKKANIKAMLQIEKDSKEKLLRRRDDSLISSSESVYDTQEELKFTGSAITQSGKLLAKYGRREFTDKILVWFAFLFFCFCVFYIVQKRLF